MLRVVRELDDILDLRAWFGRQDRISIDTETTGVDLYRPGFDVRIIQFGNCDEAWVVPFDRWKGAINELLHRFDGSFNVFNSAFDVAALDVRGVSLPWYKVDDPFIAMRLAEPHKRAGLKEVSGRLISPAAAAAQDTLKKLMKKRHWDWDTIPEDLPEYQFYAGMDVILTSRVAKHPVCQAGFKSPVYGLEMDVREVASMMERNGIRVDTDFCHRQADRLRAEAADLSTRIKDALGFEVTSNAQLSRWLLTEGVPLTRTTAGGAPSVDKDSLELARLSATPRQQKVIDAALRVRKITKLASTYFDNFVNLADGDGLLHPNIETVQAKTGRMSIRNPALQTLPRVSEDPDSRLVREAVIPRYPEHLLVGSDFDQIELRMIAAYSEDSGLIEAFAEADRTGLDFFTSAMRLVYGDPSLSKTDSRRTLIKSTFYGSSYGSGIPKMAATARIPVDDMRDIAGTVFKRFPGIKAFMKKCEREAESDGWWITTPMGRRIHIDEDFGYKSLNAYIQATAGDVFKTKMVELAHAGLADYAVLPCHDEMLYSVPKDMVNDVREILRRVMPYNELVVPIPAEPSDGCLSWSETK